MPETDIQFLARIVLETYTLDSIAPSDEARLRALAENGPGPVPEPLDNLTGAESEG
jgi:hypothetical protein